MKHRTGHLFKRGGKYYCFWRVNGKAFSRCLRDEADQPITTKEAAETARVKLMQPYIVGNQIQALETVRAKLESAKTELATLEDPGIPWLTIPQAWIAFKNSANRPDCGPSTLRQYESEHRRFDDWIEKAYPTVKALRDVTEYHAGEYAKHLNAAKVSPSTFNQHIGFLRMLWRIVGKEAKTTGNPWEAMKRKRLVCASRHELTVEQLRKVCESAKGEMRLLFGLGIYTGLRLADCATLRWGEVDLHRNTITRIPAKTARRKQEPVSIPIHATLRGILADIPAGKRSDYVLPETAAAYIKDNSGLVKTIQAHFVANGIRTQAPGTGFVTEKDEDGKDKAVHTGKRAVVEIGFHSLRHTFVSLCREANAPLAVVEAIVGHSNPAMTRHYTHVSELAARQSVAALPAVMGEAIHAEAQAVDPLAELKAKVRAIARNLTVKNTKYTRAELLALVG